MCGSILPGRHKGKDITVQDVFEAVGAHARGQVGQETFRNAGRNDGPLLFLGLVSDRLGLFGLAGIRLRGRFAIGHQSADLLSRQGASQIGKRPPRMKDRGKPVVNVVH